MAKDKNLEKRSEIENPEDIIDDIVDELDDLHKNLTESAQLVGEQKEVFTKLRSAWKFLGEANVNDSESAELYISGTYALQAARDELKELNQEGRPYYNGVKSVLPSMTNSTAIITTTTTRLITPNFTFPISESTTLPNQLVEEDTINRLSRLDPSLADTYRGIKEVLYGTRSDSERAALYLVRQMFDHFFEILAPDNEVRKSSHWKLKEGNNPNLVSRIERLRYAAHNHVSDSKKRERLIANAKHMLHVYKALNKAHKRGELDTEKSKVALKEIEAMIRDWLLAVNL